VTSVRRFLRENGLSLFFLFILILALVGQAISGLLVFNDRQLTSGGAQVSLAHYLVSSQFAVDVAENWQSEFLQFFLYIVMTVWLIQCGSPESKKPEESGIESDRRQKIGPYADDRSPRWAAADGWQPPGQPLEGQPPDGTVTWRARCGVIRTPGSESGLGKRTGRNPSTAPQTDSTGRRDSW
jgi:hypothetical protein